MIALEPIQVSFIYRSGALHSQRRIFRRRGRLLVSLCTAGNSDNPEQQEPPKPQGDTRRQELLAKIAMLQAQKVRLTDYLDERSAYLTQFAEEASSEIDQIGENALRELDEAGERIMGNIESRMQAFEESMEMNKMEIEENEKRVTEFEGKMEKDRNEGLFFKGLMEKKQVDKEGAREEADKVREQTNKSAGSVARRNIYLALIGLVVTGIAEASISSTFDWKKLAVLVLVLIGLITQVIYEQRMLSETESNEQKNND